jgi:serine/threonine protein kinase
MQLCQAAQALLYLHEELIVHGELRAENLLMSGVGRVLLSGFGSSALIGGPAAAGTGPPDPLARWDSPEVLKGGSRTFSSDVYAFGMTIYEVFSPEPPSLPLT